MTASGFGAQDYAMRIGAATRAASAAGLDGILVTPGPDLAYLCGYRPPGTERLTMLMISEYLEPTLVVPRLERPGAEQAPGAPALHIVDWVDGTDPYPVVARVLRPAGRYGVSDSAWALHLLGLQDALPGAGYAALSPALPMLRAVKEPRELDLLAAAGAAADATFHDILAVPFAGRRELDVAADLARLLREHGHGQVDFTIVGSGPNGANPHHEAGERVIQRGDMVVLDFGGLRDGYGSDTTRTVHVGPATDEESRVFEIVRAAQQAGFDAVAPGVPCQEIDRVARAGDHRGRLRRVLHPPHRTRHRADHPRAALPGDRRDPAAGTGDVFLDRAGHLPARPVRRADRGHRHLYPRRRAAVQHHPTRPATGRLTESARRGAPSCLATEGGTPFPVRSYRIYDVCVLRDGSVAVIGSRHIGQSVGPPSGRILSPVLVYPRPRYRSTARREVASRYAGSARRSARARWCCISARPMPWPCASGRTPMKGR